MTSSSNGGNLIDLFIKITDATTAAAKNRDKAKELIAEIQADFESKDYHDSKAVGKS